MRCLFLAPLKAPDHPVPSGDRAMARLFMRLLAGLGYEVELASTLRTHMPEPSNERWQEMEQAAEAEIRRILALPASAGATRAPVACVFTYHVYYKAPDLIGPRLAAALGVPYVVAEATRAPSRALGPFAAGHRAAEAAIDAAALVLALTARDREMLERLRPPGQHIVDLKPFLDLADWPPRSPASSPAQRRPDDTLALLTVAMMRPGYKLASYLRLAEALALLDRPFRLDIVGDGPAREAVAAAFAPFGDAVRLHGLVEDRGRLADLYASADLFVWPAVSEPFGAVFLEAQAHGLPCIAGADGGVADVVRGDVTGLLTPPGDVAAFAAAIRRLADDEALRMRLSEAAYRFVREERTIAAARRTLAAAFDAAGIPRSAP